MTEPPVGASEPAREPSFQELSIQRELIRKLGNFLADLTRDRPPARIHAEILEGLRDPERDLDHRVAGVYLEAKDFIPVWTAIRTGAALPAPSWETLVLPTVVHFSPSQALKSNLELATSLWTAARTPVLVTREVPVVPDPSPPTELFVVPDPPAPEVPEESTVERTHSNVLLKRWAPPLAAAVSLIALAAILLPDRDPADEVDSRPAAVLPTPFPRPSPVPEPTPSPSPSPEPTQSPTPAPETTLPSTHSHSATEPTAPRSLVVTGKSMNTASLKWQAPSRMGTGGLAHYKVFVSNGRVYEAPTTSFMVPDLTPGASYTFVVRAYNKAGLVSPPSNEASSGPLPSPTPAESPSSPPPPPGE